jgi:hypothetical protein
MQCQQDGPDKDGLLLTDEMTIETFVAWLKANLPAE